jgi:hypothetical protein
MRDLLIQVEKSKPEPTRESRTQGALPRPHKTGQEDARSWAHGKSGR